MSGVIDLSGINYIMPLLSFVFVFVMFFAILKKTKILGDNSAIQSIISVVIAIIFISLPEVRSFLEVITPWFAVLVAIMFFVIFLVMFMITKDVEKILTSGVAWVFVAILAVIIAYFWYTHFGVASNHDFIHFKHWFLSKEVYGTFWLAIVAIAVSWVMIKAK